MRKPLILFILIPLLVSACGGGQPRLAAETEFFDFGDVVNGEIVTRDLIVRNEGDAPLIVEAISSSCGCTKATLEPMSIPPGGSATLHVEFDSGAHGPDLIGPLTRQIFLTSNDPDRSELVIEFDSTILRREGS